MGGRDFGREFWGKILESRVGRKHTAVSAAKAAFSCVNIPRMLTKDKKSHFFRLLGNLTIILHKIVRL